jgi:hypothetical protein
MEVEILIECDSCNIEVDINTYNEKLGLCSICTGLHNLSLESPTVLSIDIGIQHLGMVLTKISPDYTFTEILWIELVDITVFTCDRSTCKLYHDKTFIDWTSHILQKYKDIFHKATYVLIERQPPQGLVVVEQILFGATRDKATLVAPNSVHKFFGIGQYDYDYRKIASVNISRRYIPETLQKKLGGYDRMHDISDCILFTLFWCQKKKEAAEIEILKTRREQAFKKVKHRLGMSLDDFFDMYRYIPT